MMMQKSSLLPSEYQQVEYLESNGTQYILTNYSVDGSVAISWRYSFTTAQSGDSILFGATQSSNFGRVQAEYFNNTSWYVSIPGLRYRNKLSGIGGDLNHVYDGYVSNEILTVDGVSTNIQYEVGAPVQTDAIGIFCWASNGNAQYINRGARIYDLHFTKNGKTDAHFIPCVRKSDSKPGMYDIVSRTFYTNAGTGEFIVPTSYDNSPIIERYNAGLKSNGTYGTVEGCCVTALYEYPAQSFEQTYVASGGWGGANGIMIIYKDGSQVDWWASPNLNQNPQERTCIDANSNGLRVSLKMNELDNCYFYLKETGQILFAGKNSVYYGHRNISELE